MISGFATELGTEEFAKNSNANIQNYKKIQNLTLSNIGIGTYLGDPDEITDNAVKNAIKQSVLSGVNVIDTAINYRAQKAERSVGCAIAELIKDQKITRNQIFVCTKNGYLTNDADIKQEFWEYVKNEYSNKGVIGEGDVSSGYHCMTVPFLNDQLERSLKNLGLECIDLLYLHNAVEGQVNDVSKAQFLKNLSLVFELYEQKRKKGKIKFYGMATWECFRVFDDSPQYLSLREVTKMAEDVGGADHGFRFIQLPFNMHYDQALLKKNQDIENSKVSILEAASKLGIGVFTSVPFMQGRLLAPGVIPEFNDLKPSLRALQFIRSTPGVVAPLVGQKLSEHVSENLEIMKIPPMDEVEYISLVKKLTA
ncbi:MAG: aldo/keto reductase [Nitrosopumilus sp.]|nr:aldo/keto reductase [Nitrosopumilus sp.]MDH3384482.1 aldo/keto reductase [Nitrosopumilus sp.]